MLNKFILHNQETRNLWRLTSFRGLQQKKPVFNSSESLHDDQPPCQESGRTYGLVDIFGRVILIYLAILNSNQMNLFVENKLLLYAELQITIKPKNFRKHDIFKMNREIRLPHIHTHTYMPSIHLGVWKEMQDHCQSQLLRFLTEKWHSSSHPVIHTHTLIRSLMCHSADNQFHSNTSQLTYTPMVTENKETFALHFMFIKVIYGNVSFHNVLLQTEMLFPHLHGH